MLFLLLVCFGSLNYILFLSITWYLDNGKYSTNGQIITSSSFLFLPSSKLWWFYRRLIPSLSLSSATSESSKNSNHVRSENVECSTVHIEKKKTTKTKTTRRKKKLCELVWLMVISLLVSSSAVQSLKNMMMWMNFFVFSCFLISLTVESHNIKVESLNFATWHQNSHLFDVMMNS